MTKAKKKARTDMRTYLDIFRLKFERRMTDRQIALTLNIGRSTVNNILTRFRSLQLEWPLPDEVSCFAQCPLDQIYRDGEERIPSLPQLPHRPPSRNYNPQQSSEWHLPQYKKDPKDRLAFHLAGF